MKVQPGIWIKYWNIPINKYSEDAMLMGAEMAYTAKDYEKSLAYLQAIER